MLFGIGTSTYGSSARLPDPEALTNFFEQLRASQYRLDPRQLAAAHRILLSAHAENWTLERLRFVLMILLAKTRYEQIDFAGQFDRWLGISKESKQTGLGTKLAQRIRPGLIKLFVFLVAAATFIVDRVWRAGIGASSQLTPTGNVVAPQPDVTVIGRAIDAVGSLGLRDAIRAAALVPLVLFAVFLLLQWRRRTAWVDAREEGETTEFDQIEVVPALGPIFGDRALYEIARELRRHRPLPMLELDIDRTVDATAREAGHFSAVWRHPMRWPEYVVLIEENSYRDHIARILDAGMDALKKLEVGIQRFYYNSDPRVVVADDRHRTPLSLGSLAERERHARLIIFGSGRGLLHPLTNRLGPRLRQALQPWTERIFLSTQPVEAWGQREHQLLRDGFAVGTASMAGLVAVATHVAQGSPQGGGLLESRLKISYIEPASSESTARPGQSAAASTAAIRDRRGHKAWQQLGRRGSAVIAAALSWVRRAATVGVGAVQAALRAVGRAAMTIVSPFVEWIRVRIDRFRARRGIPLAETPATPDRYVSGIAKTVPADIICAWVIVGGLVPQTAKWEPVRWVAFVGFMIATMALTLLRMRALRHGQLYTQAALSTGAFVVWVFALGEPFSSLPFYNSAYGSIALLLFTFLSGTLVPKTEAAVGWSDTSTRPLDPVPDGYFTRVSKFFPVEVVIAWTVLADLTVRSSTVAWIIFGACAITSAALVFMRGRQTWERPPIVHAIVSTVAFVVWVFATGGPFESFSFYNSFVGSSALAAYWVLAGLIIRYASRDRSVPPSSS